MMKTLTRSAALLSVLTAIAFATTVWAQATQPATSVPTIQPTAANFYEALQLDTPEHAVQSFVDAFHRGDYVSVMAIFSVDAQFSFGTDIELYKFNLLIKGDTKPVLADFPLLAQGLGAIEQDPTNLLFTFSDLMRATAQHNALPIDLRGDVVIVSKKPGPFINKLMGMTSPPFASTDILTTVAGIEGNVVFRLTQSPSGRWRVRQVIVPGGDETQLLWSFPKS